MGFLATEIITEIADQVLAEFEIHANKESNRRIAFELLKEHTDKPSKSQVNLVLVLVNQAWTGVVSQTQNLINH